MKLKSEIYKGFQFAVELYDAKDGKKGIKNESLEDILYNQLPKELEVVYRIEILTASGSYCAVKCEISDVYGRKVYGVNDVNLEHLEKEDEFPKQHPLIQATQYAVATAVKLYLNWPRLLPDDVSEAEEGNEETENEIKEEPDIVSPKAPGMNAPEPDPDPDPNDGKEKQTKAPEAKKKEPEDFSQCSDETLSQMKVKTGTYKDKTLEEMWNTTPSWFDFVLNKSSSSKYDHAREYARRKNTL